MLCEAFYFWQTLIPKSFYTEHENMRMISFMCTVGIIIGGILVPMVCYWIDVTLYLLCVKYDLQVIQIVPVLGFQLCRYASSAINIKILRYILKDKLDCHAEMLAISLGNIN